MDAQSLINFFTAVPATANTVELKEHLERALTRLFPDIDRAVVAIPKTVDFTGQRVPSTTKQQIFAHVEPGSTRERHVLRRTRQGNEEEVWRLVYQQGLQGGEARQYGEPIGTDIALDGAYCGSVLLFRRDSLGPISQQTAHGLSLLLPILRHIFTHHVAIVRATWPTDGHFADALKRISQDVTLSYRQEQVLLMLMLGRSYEHGAETLGIAVDSFRRAVIRLYDRLGVTNVKEIFTRYLGIEHHQIER